jgi:hypothetical protein
VAEHSLGTEPLDHDKRVISLFIAELNLWTGASYEVMSWPDVDTRDRQAVDAMARDVNGGTLAIEHTLLQPFTGDRADTVPFLQTAGRLDRRTDLAEPDWMIDVVFKVGAIPKGVDWTTVGQRLEEWFMAIRPTLRPGRESFEVGQLPFPLAVTISKSPLPGTPGRLLVMRSMPDETAEPVVRKALAAKLPKLAAADAAERILLFEMESPARGYWEIGETVEQLGSKFPDLASVSSVWIANTVAWNSEGYLAFHLIWPLDRVVEHQEWYRLSPHKQVAALRAEP